MGEWQALKTQAAGKWQLPLLFLSLVLLTTSVLRLYPSPAHLPLDKAVDHLQALVRGGFHDRAIRFGDDLLARGTLSEAQRAPVDLWLGRARFEAARRAGAGRATLSNQIVEHYQHAASNGLPLSASDYQHMGEALEWQHHYRAAVEFYSEALSRGVDQPLELRAHVLSLRLDRLDSPAPSVSDRLDRFLTELQDRRLDLRLWAIERKLDVYERLGRLEEAATLLARNRRRFEESDLRLRFHYLEAWLLYKTHHYDEAEARLRTIRNQVDREDPVYVRAGWLLGRVVMSDGGPQRPMEALSFFSDVIRDHPGDPYAVASRVGSAEALAMLERHDEALEAYRTAIDELPSLEPPSPVNREVLRASLAVLAESQRQQNHLPQAIDYARLAVTLLDRRDVEPSSLLLEQLGQLQSQWATRLDRQRGPSRVASAEPMAASSPEARALFADAAATYETIARINGLNEGRAAEASWRAAELYARAGRATRAIEHFQAFVAERPQHPMTPRALLRIGQLHQASGALRAAVDAYQECYRRFPKLLDSSRALVPLARCYLSMGPKYDDLAEKTLRVVLEDSEVFTPQAPEFTDAMLLLGEALNRRGAFERAIATLEEWLERYPEDPRAGWARFLLADSYRQSALALKNEVANAKFAEEMKAMRAETKARLATAQQLYRRLIAAYERRKPETLTRLDRVYQRHARLYEADCFFEMREYRRALKLYEQAASLYKDTPSALAAYVQIINSHVFLGERDEARAALARALILVDAIPQGAFETSIAPEGRRDWKRYFQWLGQSDLF